MNDQGFGRQVTYTKLVHNPETNEYEWSRQSGWLRDYKVSNDRYFAVVEGNDGTLNFVEAADIQFTY